METLEVIFSRRERVRLAGYRTLEARGSTPLSSTQNPVGESLSLRGFFMPKIGLETLWKLFGNWRWG
jgi:hypothetical protein